MELIIRSAEPDDFFATEQITREAFWNVYAPGCSEHFILHNMRKAASYIPALDLIAVHNDTIVGHMICTRAIVADAANNEHEVLCAGPLSSLPGYQRQGIGSALMKESINIARETGFSGMILFGDPGYYHRFGFRNAQEYGISTKDGQNFEPFMALELRTDALRDVNGRFREDGVFDFDPVAVDEFDKQFPPKKKEKTVTQLEH